MVRNYAQNIKEINKEFCSTYFAAYMLGEWGIEIGYNVPDIAIATMNKELAEWQMNSDCCALCNQSTLIQPFIIVSYGTLSPNPKYPLVPLFAGHSDNCCFVNQLLNNQY